MELTSVDYLDLIREITRRDDPDSLFLYDFWVAINRYFFKNKLNPCVVYQAVQPYGKLKSYGFSRELKRREIAIQVNLDLEDVFYSLIHEMIHQYQYENSGKIPDKDRIHYDQSWCDGVNLVLEVAKLPYIALPYKRTRSNSGKNFYKLDVEVSLPTTKQILLQEDLLHFPRVIDRDPNYSFVEVERQKNSDYSLLKPLFPIPHDLKFLFE